MQKFFFTLRSGKGLTSPNKNNRANFSGESSVMELSALFIQFWKFKESNFKQYHPRPQICSEHRL